MATLFDRIKSNSKLVKTGSQLFETTPDTLASVTAGQGLVPGAAVSPGAAAGLGVTKDQAKMAGSGAQLESVVRESIQPSKTYRPEITGPRTLKTEEEKAREARAAQAESLQGLGSRVSTLVKQSMDKALMTEGADATRVVNEKLLATPKFLLDEFRRAYPGIDPAQATAIAAAVEKGDLSQIPTIFKDLGINLGAKSAEEAMATLAKYVKQPEATIATAVANTLGPDVKLSSLTNDEYRDFGLAEAAKALGLKDEEMKNLSLSELQAKVEALASQDFTRVEELNRIANDPSYPENVRQDAQRQLRDLSSVSVAATEADMEKLNQEVQSADTFTIGDTTYSVEELLTDATLTSIVTAYLEDDPDYIETLKNTAPDLAAFIDSNRAALKDIAKDLGEGVKSLADTQIFNASLEKVNGVDLGAFNKETITGYDPNAPKDKPYTTTSAHQLVMNDAGVPAQDKEAWQGMKSVYTKFLADMASFNPLLAKDLADDDYTQMMTKFRNSGMDSFNEYINAYTNFQRDLVTLNNTAADSDTADATIASTIGNRSELEAFVKDYRLRQELGLPQIPGKFTSLYSILDSNGDGKLDDSVAVLNAMKGHYGLTLEKMTELPTTFDKDKPRLKDLLSAGKTAQAAESSDAIYRAVKDGILDEAELDSILSQPTSAILGSLAKIINRKDGLVTTKGETSNRMIVAAQKTLERELEPDTYRYVTADTKTELANLQTELDKLRTEYANNVGNIGKNGPALEQERTRYNNELKARFSSYVKNLMKLQSAYNSATTPEQRKILANGISTVEQLVDKIGILVNKGSPVGPVGFQGIRG